MLAALPLMVQKPYQLLPLPREFARQESRLEGDSAVWLEGDVLCVLRRQKAGYVGITGGIQESMVPIAGTDLWGLRLRMPSWRKGVIQYAFFTPEAPSPPYEAYRVWRGPEAPNLTLNQPLRGSLRHFDGLKSRRYTTYAPRGWDGKGPVIFLTNGESTEGLAQALEPLIERDEVPPIALVGIYSAPGNGFSVRPDDVAAAIKWSERPVGPSVTSRRALFGFSSGASFVMRLVQSRPDLCGTVMAVAGGSTAKPSHLVRCFFAVGTLDRALASTVASANALGAPCDTFVGGHDFEITRLAFVAMVRRAYSARTTPDPAKRNRLPGS